MGFQKMNVKQLKKLNANTLGIRVGLVLILLVVWEIAAFFINNSQLFPHIHQILLISFPSISRFSGHKDSCVLACLTILSHSLTTLMRIVVGTLMGMSVGLITGLSMHFFLRSQKANALILTIMRTIPLFALIPLFLHWFGGKAIGIYLYIAFAVFVIIATNTYEAVFNVPKEYINQSRVLGSTKFHTFRTVIFFAIQPEMIASLRNVIGLSWAFSLGAEYLAARSGLGYLLYQSYLYADMGKLIIFAVVYSVYGMLSFLLIRRFLVFPRKWLHI